MEVFRKRQADLAAKAAKGAPDATGTAPPEASAGTANATTAQQKGPAPATP